MKIGDRFDMLRRNYSHERAIRLVESAYTKDELKKMEKARRRWSRLDLSDGLECVFTALWNNAPTRDKCAPEGYASGFSSAQGHRKSHN